MWLMVYFMNGDNQCNNFMQEKLEKKAWCTFLINRMHIF